MDVNDALGFRQEAGRIVIWSRRRAGKLKPPN